MNFNVNITNSLFRNILNPEQGGAISLDVYINSFVQSAVFINVSSLQNGGAIYFQKANLSLLSSSFCRCFAHKHQNSLGGNAIFSPVEDQKNKLFKIKDSLVYKCYFKESTPGDSIILVYSILLSEFVDTNVTRNFNGNDSNVWGGCSGEITGSATYKRNSITFSSGSRMIDLKSESFAESVNIVSNFGLFLSFTDIKMSKCFIFGNRC